MNIAVHLHEANNEPHVALTWIDSYSHREILKKGNPLTADDGQLEPAAKLLFIKLCFASTAKLWPRSEVFVYSTTFH